MVGSIYDTLSKDVYLLLKEAKGLQNDEEVALAKAAGEVLRRYAEKLSQTEVPSSTIAPARYALAVLIDAQIRGLKGVRSNVWLSAAHVHVFEQREITTDDLHGFAETARSHGGDFVPLAGFLDQILHQIEEQRLTSHQIATQRPRSRGWLITAVCVGYLLSLLAYIGFLDYRYHADLQAQFIADVAALPADRTLPRLTAIGNLHQNVLHAVQSAPLAHITKLDIWDSARAAESIYRQEVSAIVPDALRRAIGKALATEGEGLAVYDSLRAWAILTGSADWSPSFLAGWAEARRGSQTYTAIAKHVLYLSGPETHLAAPDETLMEQARSFAAETPEADRALLELLRDEEMRNLGPWVPAQHIPDIEAVFVLRSGRPLAEGLPNALATAGWEYAAQSGVDKAISRARKEATRFFPADMNPTQYVIETRRLVLDKLQAQMITVWREWLEDIRVRPFTDKKSASFVAGILSRKNSPLEQVFEETWHQVGGSDPTRPVRNKAQIEATFGPAIDYLRSGRIAEISGVFGMLSVAMGSQNLALSQQDNGFEALMNLQERAQSVAALKGAPSLVAQVSEDLLAQTSAAHAHILSNPLTREWQQRVFRLCQHAVEGRYPFHPGPDATRADIDAFFGPRGALQQFYQIFGAKNIDTSGDKWRWSPEARIQGLNPETALFLQRALTVSAVFFGSNDRFGTSFTLLPLASRGTVEIHMGSAAETLHPEGLLLAWPAEADSQSGMTVSFQESDDKGASKTEITEPGLWGFLRLLEHTTIRSRDGGLRHLVDLRAEDGRVFFELRFDTSLNPVSARPLFKGMHCPPIL